MRAPGDVLVHLRRARDHAVGYTSLGSFSSRFSELVGESPSAFQRRYAAAGAPRIPGCHVFMWGLAERSAIGEKPAPGIPN